MSRRTVRTAWAGLAGAVIGVVVGMLFAKHHGKKSRGDIVKIAKDLRGKRS